MVELLSEEKGVFLVKVPEKKKLGEWCATPATQTLNPEPQTLNPKP